MDPTSITLASLLDPPGIITAGVIVTTVISLVKGVFPVLDARVSGALMAFIASAILYVFVGLATGVSTLDTGFVVFSAWLAVASTAVGIKATVDHASTAPAKSLSVNDEIAPDPDLPPEDPALPGG